MTKIDPTLYLSNQQTIRTGGNQLGQDSFLKILMAQLQNQDPMSPMEDTQFISQMATFSSLEQLMGISGSINNLVQLQTYTPIADYSHLIGKQVGYNVYDEEGSIEGVEKGIVKSISASNGDIEVVLDNDKRVSIHYLVEISENSSNKDE